MRILVLGGTGAMGVPLVKQLAAEGHDVYVTSRSPYASAGNVTYLQGNARDKDFVSGILSATAYDAVVDFMSYTTGEFAQRYETLLSSTSQYVFISSARVFAESKSRLTESSPKLLDVSDDTEYLKTDEYALAKARQENFLTKSTRKNWTIIRPSVTYNSHRLQLGALEKEQWLYRALHGRSIVFSYDVADKLTAMTHGDDVAKSIASLIDKQEALGRSFNIASEESLTWNEILDSYLDAFQKEKGFRPKVVMGQETIKLKDKGFKYQVIYARRLNRSFDCSAIRQAGMADFKKTSTGLQEALSAFLSNPKFRGINWKYEAWSDCVSKEYTPLSEIPGFRNKVEYLCYRNHLGKLFELLIKIARVLKSK